MSDLLFDLPKKDKKAAARAESIIDNCECWEAGDGDIGSVVAGDPFRNGTGCATMVCDRPFHQAAAHAWAEATTGLPARLVLRGPDGRLAL